MAIEYMAVVLQIGKNKQVSPAERLVLLALANHADRDGRCFPSVKFLAAECGMGERSVQRYITNLVDKKYLRRSKRIVEGGFWRGNIYHLLIIPTNRPANTGNRPAKLAGGDPPIIDDRPANTGTTGPPTLAGALKDEPSVEPSIETLKPNDPPGAAAPEAAKRKNPHPRNLHVDAYIVAFNDHFDVPYEDPPPKADFVQFAKWRKRYPDVTPEQFVVKARELWSKGEFTPGASLAIKSFCPEWSKLCARVQLAKDNDNGYRGREKAGNFGNATAAPGQHFGSGSIDIQSGGGKTPPAAPAVDGGT